METVAAQDKADMQVRVQEIVEEVLAGSTAFVVEVGVRGVQGSRVVDVFLDSDEGLNVDTLAGISREVGFLLDMEGLISGRHTLNVSTSGLDRPLALPRQYGKHTGRELQVRYAGEEDSGGAEVTGRLAAVHEEALELVVSDSDVRRIRFDDIIRATVKLPW